MSVALQPDLSIGFLFFLISAVQDNVVMSDRGHAQLADFGCAVLIGYTTLLFTQTRNRNGTLRFMVCFF